MSKSEGILSGASVLPPVELPETIREPSKHRKSGKKTKTTRDRFAVLNQFVDTSMVGLTRAELATWFILYRDTRNGTASTAQTDIARRVGMSDRAVRNAIAGLVAKGLLAVVYQGGINRGPSRYRVESRRKPGS